METLTIVPKELLKNCKVSQVSPSLCKIHPITPLINKNQGLCGSCIVKKFSPIIVVPGQYCEQLELITTCTTGMFGITNVEYTKKKTPLLLEDNKVVLPQETNWPTPSCSWATTRVQTKTTVQCEPYTVNFDPLTKTYVDSRFKGGVCEKSPCTLEGKLGKWLSAISEKNILDLEETNEIVCISHNKNEIWGESVPRQPIYSFCYYSYGHDHGYLVNGHFLLMTSHINSTSLGTFTKNCSEPKITPFHFKEQFNSLMDKSLHIACTLSMLRILRSGMLSSHDLWYLQPKSVGYGYWYYITGNELYSCLTELKYLNFSNKTEVQEYESRFHKFWESISVDLDYNRYGLVRTRGKVRPLFESKIDGFTLHLPNRNIL